MLRKTKIMAVGVMLVVLTCANPLGATCNRAGWQADLTYTFSPTFHNVSGIVTIIDSDTFRVDNFNYDSTGIVVYFYLGVDDTNGALAGGLSVGPRLDTGIPYVNATMTIDLPPGETLYDYNTISVWCVPAGANFGSGVFFPQPTAEYRVTFEVDWNNTDHPGLPPNDHFSGLIGGSHNGDVSFWTPYTYASLGIERMAESGSKIELTNEVNAAIGNGTAPAWSLISGGGIGSPTVGKSVSTTFQMSSCYPLVSLTSMIAPSPDWFVGVHDLPLYENGRWRKKVVVELLPWDSGTDSATTFVHSNMDSTELIHRLVVPPFEQTNDEIPPLGRFIFERTDVCALHMESDDNEDCIVNLADLAIKAQNWLLDCSQAPPFSGECFDALNQQ